jgi:hypothetical protein
MRPKRWRVNISVITIAVVSVGAIAGFSRLHDSFSKYNPKFIKERVRHVPPNRTRGNQWLKQAEAWNPYLMEDCPMLSKPWTAENFKERGQKALEYLWAPIEWELRNWESLLDTIAAMWINKTIAFIGDSNTEAQFTSLVCLFHVKYGTYSKLVNDNDGTQYDSNGISMVFLRTDRIVEKTSCKSYCEGHSKIVKERLCLSKCKQTHLVTNRVSSNVISFMNRHKPDVLTINTGAHYSRGKHGTEDLAFQLFKMAVDSTIEWLAKTEWNIVVFWRLSHINLYSNGDWNTFGNCTADKPGTNINILHPVLHKRVSEQNDYVNTKIQTLQGKEYKALVSVLDVYTLSYDRPDAMCGKMKSRNGWDCTHFCAPGVTDVWNILLLSLLRKKMKEKEYPQS